ncbi:MAG: hypothetical protein E7310_00940 [Clostridiales bacterium]|nr:hypothetical protein [Clostridiales bacterium]
MGIASLIIGIISILVGFIPGINLIMIVPAIVALVLGIVDWVKKRKAGLPKGKSIAGTICSAVALIVIVVANIFAVSILAIIGASAAETIDTYDYSDYDYDYDYYDYYNY